MGGEEQPPRERDEAPPRRREESPPRRREEESRRREDAARRDEELRGPVLEYDVEDSSDLSLPEDADAGTAAPRIDRGEEGEAPRRRRRRGRGRRGRGEGRGEQGERLPPRRSEEAPPPELEGDYDLDRDDELDLEAPVDEDFGELPPREAQRESAAGEDRPRREGDRPRRGRRRRGGRYREEGGEARPAGARSGEFEPDDRPPPARPPAARSRRDEPEDEDVDVAAPDLEDVETEDLHGGGVPTHKKIPTWDDAVNILIDANMAARANSPDRDRDRDRGRGRGGRGRGGRGR